MRAARVVAVPVAAMLLAGGAGAAPGRNVAAAACDAARVHYGPYAGGAPGLGELPWVAGAPARPGLVGLIWYLPRGTRPRSARIWTVGRTPRGASTKILWVFLAKNAGRAAAASSLVVRAERLDGPGSVRQIFGPVSYAGQKRAPSFASIVSLPTAGCWRLHVAAGSLEASVVFRAVSG